MGKLSVITVVFNGVSTITETIKSVSSCAYEDIEYVVVDGGSNDGTLEVLHSFKDFIDILISEPDQGIYDAMNKGVRACTGDWIYFLGADDLLVSETFLHIRESLANPTVRIIYGNVLRVPSNRIHNGKYDCCRLIAENISHQAMIFPRKVLLKNPFDLSYDVLADYRLNLKLVLIDGLALEYHNKVFAHFNEGGVSSTTKERKINFYKIFVMMRRPRLVFCKSLWLKILGLAATGKINS